MARKSSKHRRARVHAMFQPNLPGMESRREFRQDSRSHKQTLPGDQEMLDINEVIRSLQRSAQTNLQHKRQLLDMSTELFDLLTAHFAERKT